MRLKLKFLLRVFLSLLMVGVGVLHFVAPSGFTRIMPSWVPFHLAMVYVSGAFEIAGGIGLVPQRTRSAAGWGLIALLVAVFPANVNMAMNNISLGDEPIDPTLLWARLPIQGVLIALAYWVSRPDPAAPATTPRSQP